jgi:hypothetical protein
VKIGFLGLVMNGVFLKAWYSKLDRFVGSAMKDVKTVSKKVILDQLILAPFAIASYFSYAELLQYGISRKAFDEIKIKCKNDFQSTWKADCFVWPLANIICYGFVQLQYRVPFVCFVQLGWQTYMASITRIPIPISCEPILSDIFER